MFINQYALQDFKFFLYVIHFWRRKSTGRPGRSVDGRSDGASNQDETGEVVGAAAAAFMEEAPGLSAEGQRRHHLNRTVLDEDLFVKKRGRVTRRR